MTTVRYIQSPLGSEVLGQVAALTKWRLSQDRIIRLSTAIGTRGFGACVCVRARTCARLCVCVFLLCLYVAVTYVLYFCYFLLIQSCVCVNCNFVSVNEYFLAMCEPNGDVVWCAAARLLGLRVRFLPGQWMSVPRDCCVLSGRGLCDGPITRPEMWCALSAIVSRANEVLADWSCRAM